MLYPRSNQYRQRIDLSGFWEFRQDPKGGGAEAGWHEGFDGARPVAVPASWNDQFEDLRDYLGNAWYQTRFDLPWGWEQQRVFLRFSSVSYLAEVWLNGARLGEHEGGHLPFEFDITPHMRREDNRLVVRVDGALDERRVPPGNVPYHPDDTYPEPSYPNANFGFFPYCGIQQPVFLYTRPAGAISDIKVVTDLREGNGIVRVTVTRSTTDMTNVRVALSGFGAEVDKEVETSQESVELVLSVPHPALWSPQNPSLYDLTVQLSTGLGVYDEYTLPIGIRTIKVEGNTILLNGEKLSLKGFGRHEDFPVTGRATVGAVVIKDLSLMRWMGANCFRTAGYPVSEEVLNLADRAGWLVIDESPIAGQAFAGMGLEKRYNLSRQIIKEFVNRDKNHPSVIMWSLAGEPHSRRGASKLFLDRLRKDAMDIDKSRPFTVVSMVGLDEAAFDVLDVICVNLHPAWDTHPGQIKEGMAEFGEALDKLHEKWDKPMIVTEFSGEAMAGLHALPSEMWSEEYQAEIMASAVQVLRSKPYVVGMLAGPLADFKTPQSSVSPMGLNLQGIFTRDRRPKLAAHSLRTLWRR